MNIHEETLKIARNLIEKDPSLTDWVISKFPELKESEDERMRNFISNELVCLRATDEKGTVRYNELTEAIAWFEKQGKQKPIDEIKLKIEEGKWYVCISQFSNCIEGRAYKATSDSRIMDDFGTEYDMHSDAYKYFRPWSIQDAKDGDILATTYCILIFEKLLHKDGGVSHCHYDFRCSTPQFDFNEDENWYFGKEAKVYPATKEQRDLLFQKMNEAGYEWDSEKKELKRIEDEEYNGEDYGIDSLYHAQRILEKTLGKVDGYQSDDGILEHKCAITAVKKLYEQKPWSEEDVEHIESIIERLEGMCKKGATFTATRFAINQDIDWLKALKNYLNKDVQP